jgi:hypothetical protein
MKRDRPFDLPPRVTGPLEPVAWARRARMRVLVRVGIAQQREDRMVKRRGRQFDLATGGRVAIRRHHARQ